MKNAFGKIVVSFLLLCSVFVFAEDPVLPETFNTDNECGEPMGFMAAYQGSWNPPRFQNRIITGTHPYGGYYSPYGINDDGALIGDPRQVWWAFNDGQWCWNIGAGGGITLSQCLLDWQNEVAALTDEQRTDMDSLYELYFPHDVPESRLPMDDDLDGDGIADYFDLECSHYDGYLEYCEDNGIEPLDLVDYTYWYQNELEDWLALRQNMTDTDGDGFSDGYETIHGSEVYDGADYPLGIPDTGSSLLIVGGVDEKEPWRLEEYNDSGYSRGYVYDRGYDPFGTETLSFEDDPDWGLLDSDNDGLVNYAELANETDPYRFEFQSGFSYIYNEDGGYYSVTGYTEDGAFGDYGTAPTEEEWLASHEDYNIGDYAYNPSEYTFGDTKYDGLLDKTGKIKFDCDNVRPQAQRDYKLTFNLPIPGAGMQGFTISVMPDQSTPAGAAMEIVRQLVRGISGVIFSYVFVKHVWLAIRQY
jgi:hypothetical protein